MHTAGGVEVSTQHSTGFNGSGGDQETDMKSTSKKEQDDEDELTELHLSERPSFPTLTLLPEKVLCEDIKC